MPPSPLLRQSEIAEILDEVESSSAPEDVCAAHNITPEAVELWRHSFQFSGLGRARRSPAPEA